MGISKNNPNYGIYAWGIVELGVVALASLVVGTDQIRQFNNSCLNAGILLPQCYSDRLAEMTGQNGGNK